MLSSTTESIGTGSTRRFSTTAPQGLPDFTACAVKTHVCAITSLCRPSPYQNADAVQTSAAKCAIKGPTDSDAERTRSEVVIAMPSPCSKIPEEQHCILSSCTPDTGNPVSQNKNGYHNRYGQDSSSLSDGNDGLSVGENYERYAERMEGRYHDGTGVTHQSSLNQADHTAAGWQAHGKGDDIQKCTMNGCHMRAIEKKSSSDGARSTEMATRVSQPDEGMAGFLCDQRITVNRNRPGSGLFHDLSRGRTQAREFGTRQRAVRRSQSDGVARMFDDSDKENRDPQRRTVRDERDSSPS